jgi:outer membrane protein assembly factor BamB
MTAVEFLDKLEQQGLLDARLVSALRQQVAESRKTVSAQKIAKLLIDKGHLTAFQAKKLIDDGARPTAKASRSERASEASPATADDGLELVDEEDDDLGLELVDEAPPAAATSVDDLDLIDEDLPPAPAAKTSPWKSGPAPASSRPAPAAVSIDDALELVSDEDPSGLTPVASEPPNRANAPSGREPVTDPASLSSVLAAPVVTELPPVDPFPSELAPADPMSAPAPVAKIGKAKKIPKVRARNQWDTPLIVLGGGAIVLLAIGAFALYRFIFATNASEVFKEAQEAYRAQSYTQAISIYEEFLQAFPEDPNAGPAWILIRTATLRQATESKNWDRALDTAQQVLGEVDEGLASDPPPAPGLAEAFNEHGRPELASLLPEIAAGFATQARTAKTEDAKRLVQQAEEAMKLVNNASYIPTSLRESVEGRIDAIQEDITIAKRNINRDAALDKAVADIDQALGRDDTPAAFELRKALLKAYPDLEPHPRVIESVRKTTEKERELVALLEEPRQPLTQEDPAEGAVPVVTAAVNGESAPGVAGAAATFLARGAVYGLDATTGQVLWRRPVGAAATAPPLRLSQAAESDVVILDSERHEAVRLASKTGELRWRLPLGADSAAPTLSEERVFLATESGLLYEVQAETGASTRQVKFPQPLRSPPAVDAARGLLFQAGDHSNLYVLSSVTLDCKAVYYLNHGQGTVVTPPVVSRGQLFVAENAGADYCLIHVLPATDDVEKLKPSQAPFRLRGNVIAPPYVYERRVVVVTDLGGISLFEIDTANKKQPVSIVAQSLPTLREAAIGYSLADEGQLWVADSRLVRYEVQAARGELVRQAIRDEGGVYVAPLTLMGNVLFHARRRAQTDGVVITAADATSLRPFWVTDLGAPMVGLFAEPGGSRVAAVSAHGGVYHVTQESAQSKIAAQPERPEALDAEAAFEPPVALPDGRLAFPGVVEKNRILVLDPQAAATPKAIELNIAEGRATAAPVAVQGGLLAPSSAGLVYLADPETGESVALPLRPPLAPGEEVIWQSPAVMADGKEFIIVNDQPKAYRVTLRQQPKPHLAALTSRNLDGPVVSRLATAGNTVYGVERSTSGDTLLAFEPSLEFRRIPLPGRLAWGPYEADKSVLLATYDSLICLDGGLQARWTRPLPDGPPIAPPYRLGGDYLFASVRGTVWRVSAETGEEAGKLELHRPLAAGPAVIGSQLFVGGSDGVLHMAPLGQ